jgi:hypothetical protein
MNENASGGPADTDSGDVTVANSVISGGVRNTGGGDTTVADTAVGVHTSDRPGRGNVTVTGSVIGRGNHVQTGGVAAAPAAHPDTGGSARRAPGSSSARSASARTRAARAATGTRSGGTAAKRRGKRRKGVIGMLLGLVREVFSVPASLAGSGGGAARSGTGAGLPAVTVGGTLGASWWRCSRCPATEGGIRDTDTATGRAATHFTATHPGAPLRIAQW